MTDISWTLPGPSPIEKSLSNRYRPPYSEGQYFSDGKSVYKALQSVPSNEEWTSEHWTRVIVMDEIFDSIKGPSSSTDQDIAVFNGTDGKIIKDGGFTIAKSVPSDAVFTDTNTWNPNAITNITRNGTTFTATKYDGTTFTFTQQDNNTTYSCTNKGATLAFDTTKDVMVFSGSDGTSVTTTIKLPANPNVWQANSMTNDGYVAKSNVASQAWGTDGSGNPKWTTDQNYTYTCTNKSATLAFDTTKEVFTFTQKATNGTTNSTTPTIKLPANPNSNTWRGVVDNLSSTSTSNSLTANQGRVLNLNKAYWPTWSSWTQIVSCSSGNSITQRGCATGWYFWYTTVAGANAYVKPGACKFGSYTYTAFFQAKEGTQIEIGSQAGGTSYLLKLNA